ncbi:MAG: DinB family protein [Bacteroidota bacterium]
MEITTIQPFLQYFDRLRDRTLRVFECVPPEQIEWRPADGRFSFGDQLRHLVALERYMYVENALGRPSTYRGHDESLASGYDEVLSYAEELHNESLELLSTLTDDDLNQKTKTPAGNPITVWKWLRTMVEHEAHHRGQIYFMLRQIDLQGPPLFGLTSEQVRDRSI